MRTWGLKWLFLLAVTVACVAALFHGGEELLLRRTGHSWLRIGWSDLGPTVYDPLLGWTNVRSERHADLYGPGKDATFNSRGFRATEEYDDEVPDGRLRILCLGDSFTDGLGVGDGETFPAQLSVVEPRVQGVNLAKISYGVDQAILRYERDAEGMDADWAVLALIDDNLNRARWDRFGAFWPKPRFVVESAGALELTGVPVADFSGAVGGPTEWVERSGLWLLARRAIEEATSEVDVDVLLAGLLDRFLATAAERGHRPVLVYFPTLPEALTGSSLPLAGRMARYAMERGTPYLDLSAAFGAGAEADVRARYLEVNEHYSLTGNRLAAEEVLTVLLGDDAGALSSK